MKDQIFIALAAPEPVKLFQDSQGTQGFIILIIFALLLVVWISLALLRSLRTKRGKKVPQVLGNPQSLLDDLCNVAGLTPSDRYLLKKTAAKMNLAQPAAILLSPALLAQAAKVWQKTHRFSPTQTWGLGRFDQIYRKIFTKPS